MKKIISFKKLEHVVPSGSCGTGYSEPDKFEVTLDNGKKYTVWIDVWYRTFDRFKEEFLYGMDHVEEDDGYHIIKVFDDYNVDEAFEMYVDELLKTHPKWNKEEIMKSYKLY